MSNSYTIWQKRACLATLAIAVSALPFSVKVCHGALAVFLVLNLAEGQWKQRLAHLRNNMLARLLVLFSAFYCLSLFYTDDLSSGLFNIEKKIFLFTLPIALATSSVLLDVRHIKVVIYTFIVACFAATVICIAHAYDTGNTGENEIIAGINFDPATGANYKLMNAHASDRWLSFSYITLASGINIHPTYFSLYLGFCVIFLLAEIHRASQKSWLFLVLISAVVLYFSAFTALLSSRIVIFSILLLLLMRVIGLLRSNRPAAISLAIVTTILLALLYVNPVTRYKTRELQLASFKVISNSTYTTSTQIHASLWWLSAKSFLQVNPLWGGGIGSVERIMKETAEATKVSNSIGTYDPHNQYLYTLLSNGVIGGLLLAGLLGIPLYYGVRERNYLTCAFVFLFAMVCGTESALEVQKGIVFLAVFYPLVVFKLNSYESTSLFNIPLRAAS